MPPGRLQVPGGHDRTHTAAAEGQVHLLLCAHQPEDAIRQHHVPQDGQTVLTRRARLL